MHSNLLLITALLFIYGTQAYSTLNYPCSCCMYTVTAAQTIVKANQTDPTTVEYAISSALASLYAIEPNQNNGPCASLLGYQQTLSAITQIVNTYTNHTAYNVCTTLELCNNNVPAPLNLTCVNCNTLATAYTTTYQMYKGIQPQYYNFFAQWATATVCAENPTTQAFFTNSLECFQYMSTYYLLFESNADKNLSRCPQTVPCT
jgi:hypothetical protein